MERRYDEREIAEIFEAASLPSAPTRGKASAGGLTLAELQEIGREVGLAPERVAAAAASLERAGAAVPRRTSLGLPLTAGRVLYLPRALTDREWGLLVAELREVFNAHGRDRSAGDSRLWSNGNLHAVVEPTLDGYRLRLGTLNGTGQTLNRLGIGGVVLGAASAVGMMFSAGTVPEFGSALLLALFGGGAFAWNALRLPRWAREREEQMDYIIERVRVIVAPP